MSTPFVLFVVVDIVPKLHLNEDMLTVFRLTQETNQRGIKGIAATPDVSISGWPLQTLLAGPRLGLPLTADAGLALL